MMLACDFCFSHGHQGFKSFSIHHKEAEGPVGSVVARVQVHCYLQTVPSRALATAQHGGSQLLRGIVYMMSGRRDCVFSALHE